MAVAQSNGAQNAHPTGLVLGSERTRRRPSLTPMIDVVFLLLVFFMLAARFGADQSINLTPGGSGGEYTGPPRLIEAMETGVRVNGIAIEDGALLATIKPLTSGPDDVLVLRSREGANTQRVVDMLGILNSGGFNNIALVE